MRVKERLTNTLGCLMQPNAEVEDDTVLIKLHTALETILSSFDPECGVKWCRATSLLDFISWSFSHHQSGCNAATLALALKCTASMAKNELGFKALEESKIIEGLLRLLPSSQESNGAPSSLHDGTPSPGIDHDSIPNLNTMNSSVLHALLTVVLEMLENQAGHSWIISHNLRDKLLLPSLSYPSVFVQRASSAALTILLRSSQYQCEGTIAALTAAHTSGALHLKSSEFQNFYVKVLDDIPFGECEAWLLEAVSSLRLDITKHTIPAAHLSGKQKMFDLKFLLLVHEHVGRVLHGDDAGHSLRSFLNLVVARGKALSSSCWVRTLKLTGRWHNALAQRGHDTQLCDAFACLTLHVLFLPVLRVLENTESFENSTIIEDSSSFVNGESNDDLDSCGSAHTKSVMRLLRSCDRLSCAQEELRTLHSWIKQEEKTVTDDVGVWSSATAFRLRLAASALPNISSRECIDRLAKFGVAALRSLDRCAVIAGVAVAPDESAVLASVALVRALVKKHMGLVELATVMPLLSNIFLRPSNTRQRAVAILDCLLQFMSESEDLLPDAACVRNMVEVGLCHAAWEVRDSALRLLFPALPYQKYRTELFAGCIQRSTEALLDCTESFVQCTAAQLLKEARNYDMEGWDWVAAHDWCMRGCCSSAVLEGCDDDAVVAAALRLLGAVHSRGICPYSGKRTAACLSTSLHHAQHFCSVDSDNIRLAALQYLETHINSASVGTVKGSAQNARPSSTAINSFCADGSVWCIMQCSTDAVTSIRREALRLTHSLSDIIISHNRDTEQTSKRAKIEESATSTGPGLAVPPTSSNEASVVLESSTAIVGSGTKAEGEDACCVKLRETDACNVGVVQCNIEQLNNNSTSDDAGHQLLVSRRTNAEVDRTLDDHIEDSRQNDIIGGLTNAAASSEVDAILEAVLDYPDRLTLSALCRTRDVVSLLPSDRPQTPAVSVEKFLHFSENLATVESDAERANREVLELLEDIELQVRRRKIENVELEYSEPTHLTMDCY